MYTVKKTLEISAAHNLRYSYNNQCENMHGHNYVITVYCRSETLNKDGMVVDFNEIKELVHAKLSHSYLNEVLGFNPTAENIAKWVCDTVPHCYKVTVQETQSNEATYER